MHFEARTTPYWVETADIHGGTPALHMGVAPCPAGGVRLAASIAALRRQGIEVLISLLSAPEIQAFALTEEASLCAEAGIEFKWLPVRDHSVPESMDEFGLLVRQTRRALRDGKTVGVHCYAGIGRSCMLMACVLCAEGLSPEAAFARLSEARGMRVPDTWLQIRWVEHFVNWLELNDERE